MTIVLAIAVLALAAALVYVVAARPEEQAPARPGPAIQEATSQAVADLLRVNEESRKLDTQAAEAALRRSARPSSGG